MQTNAHQKNGAGGSALPVTWRDSAWRVPVFVRTRIGAKRPMALGRRLVEREIASLPGFRMWNVVPSRSNEQITTEARKDWRASFHWQRPQTGAQRLLNGIGRGHLYWPRGERLPQTRPRVTVQAAKTVPVAVDER